MKKNKSLGPGVGFGHGGHTATLAVIRPQPTPPEMTRWGEMGLIERDTKVYKAGKLSILVSRTGDGTWHMSIAHPERYPSWDEVAHARYSLIPDEVNMALLLPTRQDYVNIHEFCFQLWQVPDETGQRGTA